MDILFTIAFSAVFGTMGLISLVTALRWRRIQRRFRPENELRVYGKLVSSKRTPNYRNPRMGIYVPTNLLEFTYSYEVEGRTYIVSDTALTSKSYAASGIEIVCQRSDPRQCYIPGLTRPPGTEEHAVLVYASAFCFAGMLLFLATLL